MKKGFSLIELLVVLALFIIVIGIPYSFFIAQLKRTIKETSISKLDIQTIQALSVLRKDVELAGYGLIWETGNANYSEAPSRTPSLYSSIKQSLFNDSPSNAPRAVVGKRDTEGNEFSYLVLKSTAYGLSKASQHWTYISKGRINIWPTSTEANYNNLKEGDRVIVFDVTLRKIINNEDTGQFFFTISKDATESDTIPENYGLPQLLTGSYIIYGVSRNNPVAPFNRIDYFLYDSDNSPEECATGTHTLARGIMMQSNGSIQKYPILNCVADFQVAFGLDTNLDGSIDTWTQDITDKRANQIRKELKQIRVYLLVQVGKKDRNYLYPSSTVMVGEMIDGNMVGRVFNLSDKIEDYKHYRWQVIKLVLIPMNLE